MHAWGAVNIMVSIPLAHRDGELSAACSHYSKRTTPTLPFPSPSRPPMPALTRSAATLLHANDINRVTDTLSLREVVHTKRDAVRAYRFDVDLYTGASPQSSAPLEVDHCVEVQCAEVAMTSAMAVVGARVDGLASAVVATSLRAALNALSNLNVTSRRVNQAKRGPFTAALNRWRNGRLRGVTLEQLARQGAAKWLVDCGGWARIECAVVASYDDIVSEAEACTWNDATGLIDASFDELHELLHRMGLAPLV